MKLLIILFFLIAATTNLFFVSEFMKNSTPKQNRLVFKITVSIYAVLIICLIVSFFA